MELPKIIAVDGPAASGKSTLAEKVAEVLNYLYFDTGVMYRAVTLAAIEKLNSVQIEEDVSELSKRIKIDVRPPTVKDGRKYDVILDGKDVTWEIREALIDANVSLVSTYRGVREAMTKQQRRIGQRGAVVMVGRDIGTIVFPEAELKFYLDASDQERAKRRLLEMKNRGGHVTYDEILESIKNRDKIDSNREIAPLKPACDAVVINTDGLSEKEVFLEAMKYIKSQKEE